MAKLPLDSTYEAIPPPTESKGSLGAQRIRETRENARYPHQTEANVGSVAAGYTNDGRHSKGSARAFLGATAPATLLKPDGTTALTTAEMPSGTLANGSPISANLGPTDDGRLWIDSSGIFPRLQYWDGTGWIGLGSNLNGFVNGSMEVWQRSPAAAAAAGSTTNRIFWADRWFTLFGTIAGSVTRETATLPTGAISTVGHRVTGAGGCTFARTGQRIESWRCKALGVERAVNVFVTVSGKVRNTGASALTLDLVVNSANTGVDNFTAIAAVTSSVGLVNALAAGASATFSFTFDIGTASAGTPSNGLEIYLQSTAPAAFGAGESYVLTDMQLEVGRTASKPTVMPFEHNLQECVRFYQKTFAYAVTPAQASGTFLNAVSCHTDGGGNSEGQWNFECEMRAVPTVTTYNPTQAANTWRREDDVNNAAVAQDFVGTKRVTLGASGSGSIGYLIHAAAEAEL